MPLTSLRMTVTGLASASSPELAPSNTSAPITFFIFTSHFRISGSVDLVRVHLRAPGQPRVLPAVQQTKACPLAILDAVALEAMNHIACIGKAVVTQIPGTGFTALATGAAQGDDLRVRWQATTLQFGS